MDRKKILVPLIIFMSFILVLIIVLNQNQKYNKLSVSESKWISIQESRTENRKLIYVQIFQY